MAAETIVAPTNNGQHGYYCIKGDIVVVVVAVVVVEVVVVVVVVEVVIK